LSNVISFTLPIYQHAILSTCQVAISFNITF
jgi:hypothetical protein